MRRRKKSQGKSGGRKRPAGKVRDAGTEIVPEAANAATLLPEKRRQSLVAWFQLYLAIEGGPAVNTLKAKKRDLQQFIDFVQQSAGTDEPDQWTKSLTESFLRHLSRTHELSAATVNRMLATLKHAAAWIHRQRPFLVGNPCDRVRMLEEDAPDWRGLTDVQVNRLRSAAEQLVHIRTRANQHAIRDEAIFLTLLHTALRVSELLSLDFSQYDGDAFHSVKRKGKKVTRQLRVPKPARDAIARYIDDVRGSGAGPLFQSRTGKRLAPQNVDDALKKIAAQANVTLPKDERVHLSAHMLRHTCLRKAAEKDIRYAMKLSGHSSSQYIWRYTEPPAAEFETAIECLYD